MSNRTRGGARTGAGRPPKPAIDSERGAVAVIDPPDSDRVYFYLDA